MKTALVLLLMTVGACSNGGPAACAAAGGKCVIGSNACPNRGPQDCNPDQTPAGSFCCLPCPGGTKANDAGTACD